MGQPGARPGDAPRGPSCEQPCRRRREAYSERAARRRPRQNQRLVFVVAFGACDQEKGQESVIKLLGRCCEDGCQLSLWMMVTVMAMAMAMVLLLNSRVGVSDLGSKRIEYQQQQRGRSNGRLCCPWWCWCFLAPLWMRSNRRQTNIKNRQQRRNAHSRRDSRRCLWQSICKSTNQCSIFPPLITPTCSSPCLQPVLLFYLLWCLKTMLLKSESGPAERFSNPRPKSTKYFRSNESARNLRLSIFHLLCL